jgi:hypothetical protein
MTAAAIVVWARRLRLPSVHLTSEQSFQMGIVQHQLVAGKLSSRCSSVPMTTLPVHDWGQPVVRYSV